MGIAFPNLVLPIPLRGVKVSAAFERVPLELGDMGVAGGGILRWARVGVPGAEGPDDVGGCRCGLTEGGEI